MSSTARGVWLLIIVAFMAASLVAGIYVGVVGLMAVLDITAVQAVLVWIGWALGSGVLRVAGNLLAEGE